MKVRLLIGMAAALGAAVGCNSDRRSGDPVYGPGSTGNITSQTEFDGPFAVPTLAVTDVSPSDGARLVPPGEEVLVTFNAPVAPETLDVEGSVQLLAAGEPVPASERLVAPNVVAIDPIGDLPGGTEITVRVGPSLGSSDPTVDAIPDFVDYTFTTRSDVTAGALLVNELFPGTADANALPDVDPLENQFVELVNVLNRPLNLRGVVVGSTAAPNAHRFDADYVLPPGGAVVIWSRSPARGPGDVEASGGPFRFDPTQGSTLTVRSTELEAPVVVDQLTYPAAPDVAPYTDPGQSLTRPVDAGVGTLGDGRFVLHRDAPGAAGPFSPGSMANGVLFPAPSQ